MVESIFILVKIFEWHKGISLLSNNMLWVIVLKIN